ncbi:uncharacterized protein ACA1_196530 [Acanthamoeba castellanii str. Neff]|uniref:Uncharacterized protein n=1 Tax=Acanthamoeba castellanii (strain ATCC 30010 / Neff) TaxID=1257118 RepID=L8HH41_ACACF|nr:uncharacterized protein ACA1_196530 [Acanthamoeba castellanii str. Neff]ELR23761.1 hypothetical protein ACA1_196530 [Acanthamoeba castellanii str. Neff]
MVITRRTTSRRSRQRPRRTRRARSARPRRPKRSRTRRPATKTTLVEDVLAGGTQFTILLLPQESC